MSGTKQWNHNLFNWIYNRKFYPLSCKFFSTATVLLQAIQVHRFWYTTDHFQKTIWRAFFQTPQTLEPGGGGWKGGLLPYLGYIGMCGPKGYAFLAVLVWNKVLFVHSSLKLGMFFRTSYFFIIRRYDHQHKPFSYRPLQLVHLVFPFQTTRYYCREKFVSNVVLCTCKFTYNVRKNKRKIPLRTTRGLKWENKKYKLKRSIVTPAV